MRGVALLLCTAFAAAADLKDLGAPEFSCPASVMGKSKTKPTSVHSLRFADIDVVGALGDSLTAANGAGAPPRDPIAVLIQYRGLGFSVGGDKSLEQHVTVTNILKKFNPSLYGFSTGTGSADVWPKSHLNAAVPGAKAVDLEGQANDMLRRMKEHPDVNWNTSWKMVFIFIGGNDICAWCDHKDTESAENFRDNIRKAVKVLHDNMPRTIVVLTGMLDLSLLRQVDRHKYFCEGLHYFECNCEIERDITNEMLTEECKKMMSTEQELQDSGEFDDRDDFTLIIQPFFEDTTQPPLLPDGEPDVSFFAPDCFHFSQYGHAIVSKHLWNNLVEPIPKTRWANFSDTAIPLVCPQETCPFVRTTKNSVDCAKYMTPAA